MRRLFGVLLVALIIVGISSTGFVNANNAPETSETITADVSEQSSPIRVGSKQFNEQLILGYLMFIALEEAGYDVEDRVNLGGTAVLRDALENAEIDVYAEYTGTAIFNYFREQQDAGWLTIPEGASGNAYESYSIVSGLDAAINDLIWLQPAPLNNTYALAVSREFSEETGIVSAADLADYVNAGNYVQFSLGDEFAQRPDGFVTFEETYGFEVSDEDIDVIAGGTPPQSQQALVESDGEINVAMAYATDGSLIGYDLIVLTDELGAQPVYQPTPVFRGEVLRENPEIAGVLNPIFASLDNETMQTLNARVGVAGEDPQEVARDYLESNGFID